MSAKIIFGMILSFGAGFFAGFKLLKKKLTAELETKYDQLYQDERAAMKAKTAKQCYTPEETEELQKESIIRTHSSLDGWEQQPTSTVDYSHARKVAQQIIEEEEYVTVPDNPVPMKDIEELNPEDPWENDPGFTKIYIDYNPSTDEFYDEEGTVIDEISSFIGQWGMDNVRDMEENEDVIYLRNHKQKTDYIIQKFVS